MDNGLPMKERRASPREQHPISLTYKALSEKGYRELMERFDERRDRIVLFDQLHIKNKTVNKKLENLDNVLSSILADINAQLKSLTETLAMDFDALYNQADTEVIINFAGMSFQTEKKIAAGKAIELQLKLAPGLPRLLIVAEVIRSERSSPKKPAITAISFTFIKPEDKEVLLRFVKQKQNNSTLFK